MKTAAFLFLLLAVPCFAADKPLDVPPMPASQCNAAMCCPADVPPMPVIYRIYYNADTGVYFVSYDDLSGKWYSVFSGSKGECEAKAKELNARTSRAGPSPRPDGLGFCSPACTCGCAIGAPCTCGTAQTVRPAQPQPVIHYQDVQPRSFPLRSGGRRGGGGC